MQIDSPKESFEAMHLLKGLTSKLMCAFEFRSRNSTVPDLIDQLALSLSQIGKKMREETRAASPAVGDDNVQRDFERKPCHEELSEFFAQAPIPMVILSGPEHWYTVVNAPYEQMIGRKALGKTVREVFLAEEVAEFIPLLDHVFQTGIPYIGKDHLLAIPDLTGELKTRYLDIGYYPLRDNQGVIKGVTAIHIDVTDRVTARERIEESEQRFQQIANALPLLVWTARPDGFLDWYNDQWYRFTGMTYGSSWDQTEGLMHPDDMPAIRQRWAESLASGEDYEMEFRLRRKSDRHYRWMLSRGRATRDENGKILKWIGSSTDIHEQKEANQLLQKLQSELIVAKQLAVEASEVKSAFLANMSHEIRTPLASIIGFSKILTEPDLGNDERERSIGTIIRNSMALSVIVDDILDLSKVEAGKLEIEKVSFSVQELIDDVMQLFGPSVKRKAISLAATIDESVPARIFTDSARLRQILVNLIGNAVKFTSIGRIDVTVSASPSETHQSLMDFAFKISDSGIGLTRDQQSKLFMPFVQADCSTTRRFGGTGLGLTLSQRIANAMGGRILIEDRIEQTGCTFVLALPNIPPCKEPSSIDFVRLLTDSSLSLENIRVLLVDDSPDNVTLVERLLKKNGARVLVAVDGQQAVQMALTNEFDIVLMDIQMPVKDGYQATAELQEGGYLKPIVALTAHAMKGEQSKIDEAGFADYLSKPLNPEALLKSIKNLAHPTAHTVH